METFHPSVILHPDQAALLVVRDSLSTCSCVCSWHDASSLWPKGITSIHLYRDQGGEASSMPVDYCSCSVPLPLRQTGALEILQVCAAGEEPRMKFHHAPHFHVVTRRKCTHTCRGSIVMVHSRDSDPPGSRPLRRAEAAESSERPPSEVTLIGERLRSSGLPRGVTNKTLGMGPCSAGGIKAHVESGGSDISLLSTIIAKVQKKQK